ncbi:MAG TPA: hypothetical protein PLV33_04120 [Opitutaceae bacterium]|nr:hypothetical protein [Opitutaceae bacterium]HOR24023.1 hypothetical protein [Opitutaceae bacterium]HPK48516.1 hypothetical protein [Opitutaceae bacterium]
MAKTHSVSPNNTVGKKPMKPYLKLFAAFVCVISQMCFALPKADPKTETISIDFPDESRATVLLSVSQFYNLNVEYSGEIPGRIRIKMKDRTWQSLFDELLHPVGFDWREDNGVIRVYDKFPASRLPIKVEGEGEKISTTTTICAVFLALFGVISFILNLILIFKVRDLSKVINQTIANKSVEPTRGSGPSAASAPVEPDPRAAHH